MPVKIGRKNYQSFSLRNINLAERQVDAMFMEPQRTVVEAMVVRDLLAVLTKMDKLRERAAK